MLGTYPCDQLLGFLGGTDFDAAPSLYFGFNNGNPSSTGANEITGSYSSGRVSYSGFDAIATVGASRQTQNSGSISWTATAAGSASYYSVWDTSSGGNFLFGGICRDALGNPQPLVFGNGDTITLPAASVILAISNAIASNYLADMLLDWLVLAGTPPIAPTDIFIGLATAALPDGTVTDVTSTIRSAGYKEFATSAWGAIATVGGYRQILYPNNIDFGNSEGAVTGLSLITAYDAFGGGNLLSRIALSATKNVVVSEPIKIDANAFGFAIR